MKQWIRRYLGIERLQETLCDLTNATNHHTDEVIKLRSRLTPTLEGVAKLLAKVDPLVAQSEFDSDRKAASDKLGEEVINRLIGEDLARRHSLGEE